MFTDLTYRSKVDLWLVGLVGLAAATPLLAAGWLALQGEFTGFLLLTCWGGVMVLVIGGLSFPVRYTLRADHLHIQSGWLHWNVSYSSLRQASLSRNPLSAPAWSLQRVKLVNATDSVILVSPEDRESFINELVRRCPQLARSRPGSAADPALS
ncbi:MAG: PH domain-containing protein [Candidatus Didemnitutus sp.]|nr:PH domain-containing protein [Candidatus Didemnitutus sp.]